MEGLMDFFSLSLFFPSSLYKGCSVLMNSFKNNGDCCNCTGELTVSDVGDRMGSNHRVSFLLSLSVTKRGSASGFSL